MKKAILTPAVFLVIALLGRAAYNQVIIEKDPRKDMTISAQIRNAVLDAVLKKISQYYVLPETAEKVEKSVRKKIQDQEYDSITSGIQFAEKLTADLQEVSHDKHLRIFFSSKALPEEMDGEEPSTEEVKRYHQQQRQMNSAFQKVERLPGNIGYIDFRGFMDPDVSAETVESAMNFVANTDALIFDIRRNGGGDPKTVALICTYLFDEKPVHLNDLHWRKDNKVEEFWTLKSVPGKRYLGKDVYVLTSKTTFSGAEEFANNLKALKRAVIVGETTGGGANPGEGFRVQEHFAIFIPTGRAVNPITKTNWEGTGVKPDVEVAADQALEKARDLAIKKLLAQATPEKREQIEMDLEMSKEEPR